MDDLIAPSWIRIRTPKCNLDENVTLNPEAKIITPLTIGYPQEGGQEQLERQQEEQEQGQQGQENEEQVKGMVARWL